MHLSRPASTTVTPSSQAYPPSSSINYKSYRTLQPGSSPAPRPQNTSPPSSSNSLFNPVSTSKTYCSLTKPYITWPPPYLADLLQEYTPSRFLRSSSAGLLTVPIPRLVTMGAQAFFPDAGTRSPRTSDSQTQLKTHLFKSAYSL